VANNKHQDKIAGTLSGLKNLPYNLPNATEDFLVGLPDIGTAVGFPSTVLVGFCRHPSHHRRCLVGSVP
jgi:hypothetical protein